MKRGNQYSDNEYQANPPRALRRLVTADRDFVDAEIRKRHPTVFLSDSTRMIWLMTDPVLREWVESQGIEL